jgi:hypothetical protein
VRQSLHAIHRVLNDPMIPDDRLRQAILALMPSAHMVFPSRAAAIRGKLSEHARYVRPLVKLLVELAFEGEAHAPLLMALSQLRALYARRARQLPADIDTSVAPRWAELIGGVDRQRALRAFEAATLLALRKALRNGSVWVAHSLAYCRRNAMLIPEVDWEQQRPRWYQYFGLPLQASGYTPQLLANLEAGLTSLAEAVEAGEVGVDEQGVHCSGQVKTDTKLSCLGDYFVLIGTDISKVRMFTPTVVEHLDIIDHVITGLLTRPIRALRRALTLQAAEKSLHDRIV